MKYLSVLIILGFTILSANADLFQSNNPFPEQTDPERLNNIYETKPSAIQKEVQQKKKSWWKVKNETVESQTENKSNFKTLNEGVQKGNFYVYSD